MCIFPNLGSWIIFLFLIILMKITKKANFQWKYIKKQPKKNTRRWSNTPLPIDTTETATKLSKTDHNLPVIDNRIDC